MITPLSRFKKHLLWLIFAAFAQQLDAQSTVDKYVDYGLKNNLVLQQKNVSLESAMYSLREARSLFLPSISLLGDYQSGEGGRSWMNGGGQASARPLLEWISHAPPATAGDSW